MKFFFTINMSQKEIQSYKEILIVTKIKSYEKHVSDKQSLWRTYKDINQSMEKIFFQ
jgi:hypothetical protein